jgi:hypothetical protein
MSMRTYPSSGATGFERRGARSGELASVAVLLILEGIRSLLAGR